MSNATYNGWSNYETWNLALWIDNEERSYVQWRDRTDSLTRDCEEEDFDKWDAVRTLADELKEEIESSVPELTGFFADILNAALSEVDYREIALHWIDDALSDQVS